MVINHWTIHWEPILQVVFRFSKLNYRKTSRCLPVGRAADTCSLGTNGNLAILLSFVTVLGMDKSPPYQCFFVTSKYVVDEKGHPLESPGTCYFLKPFWDQNLSTQSGEPLSKTLWLWRWDKNNGYQFYGDRKIGLLIIEPYKKTAGYLLGTMSHPWLFNSGINFFHGLWKKIPHYLGRVVFYSSPKRKPSTARGPFFRSFSIVPGPRYHQCHQWRQRWIFSNWHL